uniref:uL30m n=1 Tax=Polytomella magna TaxID=353565 RepID=UPI002240E3A7|nr:Chain Ax, uL30m [Polytomella magna]8APN_Ax Chain Ax, uL30m [Polytomella magna]8APO_Ax Chain Ax, uL30m [Polytomella magna]
EPVRSLFVTLRRSYIGKAWFHREILQNFRLKKIRQTVEVANTPSARNSLAKIPHLVTIETDKMYYLRNMKKFYEQLLRPPVQVSHEHAALSSEIKPVHNLHSKHVQERLQEHAYPSKMEGYVLHEKKPVVPRALRSFAFKSQDEHKSFVLARLGIFSEEAKKIHLNELRTFAKRDR